MKSTAINAPGDPLRSKASPELRELARRAIDGANPDDALELVLACEVENVNAFKLILEERRGNGGAQ